MIDEIINLTKYYDKINLIVKSFNCINHQSKLYFKL